MGVAEIAEVSPFAAPDNLTFDDEGNIWISTDGMPNNLPGNDGLFAAATEGEERTPALTKVVTKQSETTSQP